MKVLCFALLIDGVWRLGSCGLPPHGDVPCLPVGLLRAADGTARIVLASVPGLSHQPAL